ncbi:1,4-alpha-glucan branching enzyme GlgB [Micromonospora sp. MH99]|nr:1,4-alpha-glucan branching enzyme GlgB [Micromonospora sp. MH99]
MLRVGGGLVGSELADERKWSEERGLDWYLLHDPTRAGVQRLVGDINRAYRDTPALWTHDTEPAGFRWIAGDDVANNTVSFVRIAPDGSTLVCVANFSARPLHHYRIGLPAGETWTEVLNTDAHHYGGSGVGNLGAVHAEDVPWHGLVASVALQVPPLGVIWLRQG